MNQTEQPMSLEQPKLTIEQEQEQKLKSKYPNPQKPGGSAFIHKMLHKGSKKYFDSGDYNMAKSKKQGLLNGLNKNCPLVPSINQTTVVNSSSIQPKTESVAVSLNDQAMCDSPMNINLSCNEHSTNTVFTPSASEILENSALENSLPKPTTPTMNQTDSMNTTNNDTNTNFLNLSNSNSQSPLASSLSSSNLNNQMIIQNNQTSHSLSSCDKVTQIQINEQQILDSEEIGHGIPTPECLPQSRKHSIVQSKLATPRLSSS